jgi:hypothetical protein
LGITYVMLVVRVLQSIRLVPSLEWIIRHYSPTINDLLSSFVLSPVNDALFPLARDVS